MERGKVDMRRGEVDEIWKCGWEGIGRVGRGNVDGKGLGRWVGEMWMGRDREGG